MSKEKCRTILQQVIQELEIVEQPKKNERRIHHQLQYVEDDLIISEIGMANLPLILMLMQIKYRSRLRLIPAGHDVVICAGTHNIANMSYLAVELHFLEVQQDFFIIEGITSIPSVFSEGADFLILHNGQPVRCDLTDKNYDRKLGTRIYEKRLVFHTIINPHEGENSIQFANVILSGQKYVCPYGKINAMRFFPVSDCLEGQYCIQNSFLFYLKQGTLFFEAADATIQELYEERYQKKLSLLETADATWAIQLRRQYFRVLKRKTKPIWLFMDRPDHADDNAEILFRYVREKLEIDSYYIISENSPDYNRLQKLGNIIPLYSPQHELLALLADYVISSQSNGVVENPFWEKSEYVRDLYHQAKIIFLQHGVIKDDMSPTLNRFNTNFTGFITSSPAERNSILQGAYDYPESKVWLTGLPRFDKLYNNPQKYLLIMPSWRKEFLEQVWDEECHNMLWKPIEGFAESLYVKKWRSLLDNMRLKETCKIYGYRILFIPHALMRPYVMDLMTEDSAENKPYRDVFAESNIMVTDYSSVAFDFAYLQKPILYYQFDREDFFNTHTYQKGYFDYEKDGFGEVVSGEENLVTLLIDYIKNECAVKETYHKRMDTVFAYRDGNACERVFQFIRQDMSMRKREKVRSVTDMEKTDGKDLLIHDLKLKIKKLEIENEKLRTETEEIRHALEQAQYSLDETRKSFTYRLGYALTSLPRKIKK